MDRETQRKELLNLLNDISDGFDRYQESLEDDSKFWGAWVEMRKYIMEKL